ncbi:MAG: hypothetical protein KJ709_04595 [Nanoarchaeota archaeon]|nr:hypothetical protein [Nanoarchaeota archaeon]
MMKINGFSEAKPQWRGDKKERDDFVRETYTNLYGVAVQIGNYRLKNACMRAGLGMSHINPDIEITLAITSGELEPVLRSIFGRCIHSDQAIAYLNECEEEIAEAMLHHMFIMLRETMSEDAAAGSIMIAGRYGRAAAMVFRAMADAAFSGSVDDVNDLFLRGDAQELVMRNKEVQRGSLAGIEMIRNLADIGRKAYDEKLIRKIIKVTDHYDPRLQEALTGAASEAGSRIEDVIDEMARLETRRLIHRYDGNRRGLLLRIARMRQDIKSGRKYRSAFNEALSPYHPGRSLEDIFDRVRVKYSDNIRYSSRR